MHFWCKFFRGFDLARYPPCRRVGSSYIFHWTPRLNTYKKGRRTFRSIRTRSLRKIEVEVEESHFPLLRWKRAPKKYENVPNSPNDKDKEQNSMNPRLKHIALEQKFNISRTCFFIEISWGKKIGPSQNCCNWS